MSRLYPLIDRLHDGKLADRLIASRSEGESLQKIRDELRAEGFSVSIETIRQWCKDVGAEKRVQETA